MLHFTIQLIIAFNLKFPPLSCQDLLSPREITDMFKTALTFNYSHFVLKIWIPAVCGGVTL